MRNPFKLFKKPTEPPNGAPQTPTDGDHPWGQNILDYVLMLEDPPSELIVQAHADFSDQLRDPLQVHEAEMATIRNDAVITYSQFLETASDLFKQVKNLFPEMSNDQIGN